MFVLIYLWKPVTLVILQLHWSLCRILCFAFSPFFLPVYSGQFRSRYCFCHCELQCWLGKAIASRMPPLIHMETPATSFYPTATNLSLDTCGVDAIPTWPASRTWSLTGFPPCEHCWVSLMERPAKLRATKRYLWWLVLFPVHNIHSSSSLDLRVHNMSK